MSESTTPNETTGQTSRRTRTGRKRTRFAVPPRQPIAVRALWQSATEAEQETAHELCMAVLEYWLGKSTKQEIAARLEVPPLRVWQLSQMALSGMLAGLLRQPKTRPRGRPMELASTPGVDVKALRKRIVELERKLSRTEDLVRVLRDLPWAPKETAEKEVGRAAKRGNQASANKRRGALASRSNAATSRSGAGARGGAARDAAGPGEGGESNATDDSALEA